MCGMTYLGFEDLDHPVSETVNEHDVGAHLPREGEYKALHTLVLNFARDVAEYQGP